MFLAPWFLLGLLAAGLPAVIHLRRSRRTQRIIFSTNRFFDEAFLRAAKQAKLHDLLMMFLRMLLLMLLALALAQPLLRLPQLAGLTGTGRVVAIVIDNSASMNRITTQGTSFDLAKTTALSILDELSPAQGDLATIVLAGWTEQQAQQEDASPSTSAAQPSSDVSNTSNLHSRILFSTPTADFSALRKAINELQPTDLGTDLSGAVAAAGKAIVPTQGPLWNKAREVHVISDLQPTGFAGKGSLNPGPGTGLYLISLAPDVKTTQQNLSIDALQYDAPQPMLDVPFTFRTLVVNHSNSPLLARLNLIINDQIAAFKTITLEPSRSQIVRIEYRFTKPGWHKGRVQIVTQDATSIDPLPADNNRYFALNVLPSLKILAVNGSPSAVNTQDELFFLRLALTAHAPDAVQNQRIEITQITPDQLSASLLKGHPVVILANVADLSPAALDALEQHVDQGAGLFITLGNQTQPDVYNQWSTPARSHHGLLPATLGKLLKQEPQQEQSIVQISPDHPVTAGFFLKRFGDLSTAHYGQTFELAPVENAQVLLRTNDDEPFLVERNFGRGRVMLYASTIDRDWNNQPLQPAYVPLILRIASHLAQGSLQRSGFFYTGQSAQLPQAITQKGMLTIELPDHAIAYLHPGSRQNNTTGNLFTDTMQAGVYQISEGENEPASRMFAANIPAGESEISPVTQADIADKIATKVPWVFIDSPAIMSQSTRLARQGTGLWQQLLVIALLIAVCEPWLANRWTQWRSTSSEPAAASTDLKTSPATPEPMMVASDISHKGSPS